jgi:hypothetical protein
MNEEQAEYQTEAEAFATDEHGKTRNQITLKSFRA